MTQVTLNNGSVDSAGSLVLKTNGTTAAVTIDASQNVGIGTSSPTYRLSVKQSGNTSGASIGVASIDSATDTVFGFGYDSSSGTNRLVSSYLSTGAYKPISFWTADAERVRIDSSGNLLVGTTSTLGGAKTTIVVASAVPALAVANSATADSTVGIQVTKSGATNNTSQRYIGFNYNGGGNGNGAIAGNGDSQATFITLSDARLKENIIDLPSQLENVMALRPVEFDYKATGGHQIGFVAQEVQAVYPDLVSEGDDGYLTLAGFDKNTARLVKAIQEQQAMIEQLKADVAALKVA